LGNRWAIAHVSPVEGISELWSLGRQRALQPRVLSVAHEAPVAWGSDESRCGPPRRRIVDANAFERDERFGQVRDALIINCADVFLRRTMTTALRSLKNARDCSPRPASERASDHPTFPAPVNAGVSLD
jgi:hypothetical protein